MTRVGRGVAAAMALLLLAGCGAAPATSPPADAPGAPPAALPSATTPGTPALDPRPGGTLTDVPYAGTDPTRQALDVHFPAGRGPWPVVVFVHGGSWAFGDKAMPAGTGYGALREALLAQGWAVASVQYRFSAQARFPAQLHDVKAAVRFLRAHADELALDADRVALAGDSAGAHLAQLTALTADEPAWEGAEGVAGPPSSARAVVSLYGVSDLTNLGVDLTEAGCPLPAAGTAVVAALLGADPTRGAGLRAAVAASPVSHAAGRRTPMLLVHGTEDCVVPPAQSRRMASALAAAGGPVQLELITAGHIDGRLYSPEVLQGLVVPFLARVLA
nr:alpha/beta hydrolase [Propionibacterium sp.]